jgi:hypothetical protein
MSKPIQQTLGRLRNRKATISRWMVKSLYLGLNWMRRQVSICFLILLSICFAIPASFIVLGNYEIPFQGMKLVYYTETTPALLQETGLTGQGLITLTFHDLSVNSTKMDIIVNASVTANGHLLPEDVNSTTNFPTNRDTLVFLRNGGQQNIDIYTGCRWASYSINPRLEPPTHSRLGPA